MIITNGCHCSKEKELIQLVSELFLCKIDRIPSPQHSDQKSPKEIFQPHNLLFRKIMNNPLAAQEFI